MNRNTSWDKHAKWYDVSLDKKAGYHSTLVLPNLLRLMDIDKSDVILDLACGQGFFAREFFGKGAQVIGVDISENLIQIAKDKSDPNIKYYVSAADNLPFIKKDSIAKITIILALQNIENVGSVIKECQRLLRQNGKIFIVINHPSFRIPKHTSWGFDDKNKIQFRKVDSYLTESRSKIQMHPGSSPDEFTWSFNRPLQFYSKIFNKNNLAIAKLEEWNSNKESEPGPKAEMENKARKEIPLFLFMEVIKIV